MINKITKIVNSIKSIIFRFSEVIKDNQSSIILFIGVILISIISFGAGRLTDQPKNSGACELQIIDNQISASVSTASLTDVEKKASSTPTVAPKISIQPSPASIPALTSTPNIQIIGNKNSKIYRKKIKSFLVRLTKQNPPDIGPLATVRDLIKLLFLFVVRLRFFRKFF